MMKSLCDVVLRFSADDISGLPEALFVLVINDGKRCATITGLHWPLLVDGW